MIAREGVCVDARKKKRRPTSVLRAPRGRAEGTLRCWEKAAATSRAASPTRSRRKITVVSLPGKGGRRIKVKSKRKNQPARGGRKNSLVRREFPQLCRKGKAARKKNGSNFRESGLVIMLREKKINTRYSESKGKGQHRTRTIFAKCKKKGTAYISGKGKAFERGAASREKRHPSSKSLYKVFLRYSAIQGR